MWICEYNDPTTYRWMVVDGTLRSRVIYDGHRIAEVYHSIIKEEYLSKYKNMIQ